MRILCLFLVFAFLLGTALAAAAPPAISDDALFDMVRRRLANDPEVKGGTLGVEVANSVVTLTGSVDSEKIKQRAEKLTRKVKGVKDVVNQLSIKTL